MNIQWNIVTWYSKLLAVIFFIIILPIWTFYLGMRYEEVVNVLSLFSNQTIPTVSTNDRFNNTIISTSTTSILSKTQTGISLNYIYPKNTSFVIEDFPSTTFTIKSVVKATGTIQDESGCGSRASETFLKNLYLDNTGGLCLNLSQVDGEPLALIVVNIDASNDGDGTINDGAVQLIYTTKVNGKEVTRFAQPYLNLAANPIYPFSSREIRVGFMIPSSLNEFSLTYGYVGVGLLQGEKFFAGGQGGYIVNFITKSIVPIQG